MNVAIMVGGKGTRIAELYPELPKPMIPLCGRPILQHQVEQLARQGFTKLYLITGYKADAIRDYFGDGSDFDIRIEYIHEEQPLGTGGALALLPKEDTLLLMGDLYLNVDFGRFVRFFHSRQADIALFTHPNSHPFDSGLVTVDSDTGRVMHWYFKNDDRPTNLRNLVNAGIYLLSSRVLPGLPTEKRDLDKTIVAPAIEKGKVYSYRSTEYVKDVGTPERLGEVTHDIENGVARARNLAGTQRAVFLDRDGVLNVYKGFVRHPDEIVLLDGAAKAVGALNKSTYLSICVTNQPVIARGEVTYSELDAIHGRLDSELARTGAYLDDMFFCPHHPHKGYAGEVPELKMDCDCRKPKPGMLFQAADKYNIDLAASWMVGDSPRDMEAGKAAGCKTIGVLSGEGTEADFAEAMPDMILPDLAAAVVYILKASK